MKMLLLGLSGSGKTTVSKLIATKYGLSIYEADDEVEKINGGVWPDSDDIITQGFEIANKKAVKLDNVIYVTSWLEQKEIKKFFDSGFKIYEMHADFDELVRRKRIRDSITSEKIEKFKLTYKEYFDTILAKNVVSMYKLSIDSTKISTKEIYDKIAS